EGESIIIVNRNGDPYTFALASPLKIVPAKRAHNLVPGAFVTIIAPNNAPNNKQVATGIVVHPGVPNCFAIPDSIKYRIRINVVSTATTVPGSLVSINNTQEIDITFDRIPQTVNPERTAPGLVYEEFRITAPLPPSAATISADSVCFVINIPAVVASGPIRYCSNADSSSTPLIGLGSPLSVAQNFPVQYADLQNRVAAAAAHIDFQSPLDMDQILSTIEDAQRIRDCANASGDAAIRAACASDIIVAPVTQSHLQDALDSVLGMPSLAPTPIDVGVIRVLQTIVIPTVDPSGSVTILPGDYRLDYWFDVNGAFYAATLTGLQTDNTPIINEQAPALPALFLDVDGLRQPLAQITSCRIARWCFFEGGCR
ncbi:MAG TPA: hypothetical protein VK851_08480, partial [Anaerolineales bacterium]|nr:hypothetical protein [Anaerolineales bacterium]